VIPEKEGNGKRQPPCAEGGPNSGWKREEVRKKKEIPKPGLGVKKPRPSDPLETEGPRKY